MLPGVLPAAPGAGKVKPGEIQVKGVWCVRKAVQYRHARGVGVSQHFRHEKNRDDAKDDGDAAK